MSWARHEGSRALVSPGAVRLAGHPDALGLLALVMDPSGRMFAAPLALSSFAGARRVSDQTVVAAAAVLVAIPVIMVSVALQ